MLFTGAGASVGTPHSEGWLQFGVTSEFDDSADNSHLYTQPEDVLRALGKVG